MNTIPQPALSGGELAPSLWGRVDLSIYQTSVRTALNFIPQVYGGTKNRQGSRYVADSYASGTTSRLVPFTFNADQSYVLEITGGVGTNSGHLRIFSRGALVCYTQAEVSRLAALGKTVTVNTPVTLGVPWQIGDVRKLKLSQSADVMTVTHPAYEPQQVCRMGPDHWELRDLPRSGGPWLADNIAKASTISSDGSSGVVTLTSSLPDVFTNREGVPILLRATNYGQAWEPGVDVTVGDIRRSDGKYYRVKGFDGTSDTTGKTGTLRPTHFEDDWSDGKCIWTYLNQGWGWATIKTVLTNKTATAIVDPKQDLPFGVVGSGLIGNAYTVASISAGTSAGTYTKILCAVTSVGSLTGSITANLNLYVTWIDANGNGNTGPVNFPAARGVVSGSNVEFDVSWESLPTGVGPTVGTGSFTVINNVVPAGTPMGTYKWAWGAWGADQGWPACSAYFQQRQVFGGSKGQPQAAWTSRTADYTDFSTSNPIRDDDSLSFTIASASIDGITHLYPLDRLVLFTLGGNWATSSDVLTPANLNVKPQNYYGCSDAVPPVGIGNTVLYYGRNGTIRDMSYDLMSDTLTGNDLTFRANHLFQNHQILEWSFQQAPFPILWCVRDDGVLLSCTYSKEEKILGWARHTFSGTVESVCVINECGEDHVYLAVKRGSTRTIECMYGRVEDEWEACFVDAAKTFDGRIPGQNITVSAASGSVTITASGSVFSNTDVGEQIVLEDGNGVNYRINITVYTSATQITGSVVGTLPVGLYSTSLSTWAFARVAIGGLSHLNGKSVSVLSEGTYASGTVSGGTLTFSACTPSLGPSCIATVGLPITADLQSLAVAIPGQQGPLLEARKLIPTVNILVENSRSCFVGPDVNHLQEATLRSPTDSATALTHGTGMIEVNIPTTWNNSGSFCIRHTKPFPLSILALLPQVEVGG